MHPVGFEPTHLAALEPESSVYANFTTGAAEGKYTKNRSLVSMGPEAPPLSHFFWDELSHFFKNPNETALKFIFGMAEINGGLFFFAAASADRRAFSRWCSLILARIRAKIPGKTKVATSILRSFFFALP